MASEILVSRRKRALFAGFELVPLLGPVAFSLIYLGAYVLPPLGTGADVIYTAVAIVLGLLAITPILGGLGWMIAGRGYIGGLVLLLRAFTLLVMALLLTREAPSWGVAAAAVAFVAEPLASAAALAVTTRHL